MALIQEDPQSGLRWSLTQPTPKSETVAVIVRNVQRVKGELNKEQTSGGDPEIYSNVNLRGSQDVTRQESYPLQESSTHSWRKGKVKPNMGVVKKALAKSGTHESDKAQCFKGKSTSKRKSAAKIERTANDGS